ncbi:speckle-type POZ protein-like [Caerostris extrusa]|uniref:Speckle-type POZ protein-like n=1 Tax=Caerostris extrusa TaxID=172846 RepID=A0AAV4RJT8_CAEEX|nr:speckle-type POZ protein-like [Caerostris extrusa]
MWRSDGKSIESEQLHARTIIRVMRRSFTWNIEKFSSLEPGLKNTFSIRSLAKNVLMLFELCITGGQCSEEVVNISLKPSDDNIKFLTFKSFVVDSKGNQVECASHEFWSDDIKDGAKLTLLLTKKKLMESKALYLPNDVLSLRCECDFSTGIALEEINKVDFGTISSQTRNEVMENEYRPVVAKPAEISLALTEDLKAMYDDGLISDTELRTKTRKFPAHKNILSARSPVFKAMFSSDMLENSKGCVDIEDLEDETVHAMLVYMYTDSMKETSWKSIVQLFAAADKYAIISLKNKCSSFLKENLSEENVCEILVMADRHQEGDLKAVVENYIISRDKDIFGSVEWKRLMDTNPKLAAETMFKKVYGN